eukprot:CAMPEP_0196583852 /NCGR_PEP_ID=MMETSP1081-20130531/44949_1 /TAXON_ID=36882 /ORGANISM="Pyramimonas amylifera, Strain CCMP720" /LENGTH=98 /DNA_ID=CAMNT_0041904873 /DNA_START=143 /DNA_END=439 /DNA_ORIENTATION=-
MLRHVVLLQFKEGIPPGQVATITEKLNELPSKIAQITKYTAGPDLGLANGNADYAIVADFNNQQDFEVYASHHDHQQVIVDYIKPYLAKRTATQLNID